MISENRLSIESNTAADVDRLIDLQKNVYLQINCYKSELYKGPSEQFERRLNLAKKRCSKLFTELFVLDGIIRYQQPTAIRYLSNFVMVLYLFLLVITDLLPTNSWNSIWLIAIISFCISCVFALSKSQSNPLKKTSRKSVQRLILDGLLYDKKNSYKKLIWSVN